LFCIRWGCISFDLPPMHNRWFYFMSIIDYSFFDPKFGFHFFMNLFILFFCIVFFSNIIRRLHSKTLSLIYELDKWFSYQIRYWSPSSLYLNLVNLESSILFRPFHSCFFLTFFRITEKMIAIFTYSIHITHWIWSKTENNQSRENATRRNIIYFFANTRRLVA
jgi:hypothetical protein